MRRIFALLLGLALMVMDPLSALAFSDTTGHWASGSINHLTARNIVHGRTSSLFMPESPVTRAEFASLLVNGLGMSDDAASLQKGVCLFRDVSSAFWARGSLELCREMNVMIPDDAGRCSPNRVINRGEAAAMVTRALHLTGSSDARFADNDTKPEWIRTSASAVSRNNIMNGFPDGTFRAQSGLTRAQAVVIIENILNYYGEKYMAAGTIVKLDQSLRNATVRINGQDMNVDLANTFTYSALSKGQPQIPSPCYFDFDKDGDLIYCQETTSEEAARLIINGRAMPTYSGTASPSSSFAIQPETSGTLINSNDPRVSSQVNKSVIAADELQNAAGVDGKGIRVAVIDTGIDVGHSDLARTSDNKPKVVDWLDMTQEGSVDLQSVPVVNRKLVLSSGQVDLGEVGSVSGHAYFGYFDPSDLPVKLKTSSNILVAALDTKKASFYDTVLVDTDNDGSLSDEKPLAVYGQHQQFSSFVTGDGKSFDFVVSEIAANGKYVKLGFDSNGHGTKMAGIIAGNGLMQGVAPGAQLVAVKVFDGYGTNDVQRLEEAIKMVGNMGVDVVNISMGYFDLPDIERSELEDIINQVSEEKGIVFCIATGNMGPNIGSIAYPSSADKGIGVGGFITPSMWLLNYGWKIDKSTLWQFSSVGPDSSGRYPFVVAPASGVSTDVCWKDGYSMDEGTSIAAPYVSGGAALLICAARKKGINASPETIKQAIAEGADTVGDYQPCEVGHGSLNLLKAWDVLKKQPVAQITVAQGIDGSGLYSRNAPPAQSWLTLYNSGINRFINLSTTASWITLAQTTMQVPYKGSRNVAVQYSGLKDPGLYSSFIIGDDTATSGIDMEALETTVVPYVLNGTGNRVLLPDQLAAGLYKRYFIKVPEGKGKLNIKINIPRDITGKYLGRVRLHLASPSGELVERTGYAGSGYPDDSPLENINVDIDNPQSGVWEIVVFSAVTLGEYNLSSSKYSLESSLTDWTNVDPATSEGKYTITSVPGIYKPGEPGWITLYFWDKINNVAGTGQVMINNLLYEIRNGRVRLQILPTNDNPVFDIAS